MNKKRVKDMVESDFMELCKQRQEANKDKYKDAHKKRDLAKDLMEELADIYNISVLHKKEEEKYLWTFGALESVLSCVQNMFSFIVEMDNDFEKIGVKITDELGGNRIYFGKSNKNDL